MNMKVNNKKMVRGFMCHSPASTAVCVTGDLRSVIVPRRPDQTLVDHARLMNATKYTRIAERRRYLASSASKRSTTNVVVPSLKTTTTTAITTTNDQAKVKKEHNSPQSLKTTTTKDVHVQIKKENNHPQLPPPDNVVQEVVMRVSLHCQGCAGKVKKLLSKMEGVTSFTVDLETKRVTVMGHVSPVGVLESISKVKKAEFWSC